MKNRKKEHTSRRIYILLIAVAVVVLAGGLIYHCTRSKPAVTATVKQAETTKSNTSVPSKTSTSSVPTLPYQAPVVNPINTVPGGVTPSVSSVTLAAPEGTFVSNHGNGDNPAVTSTTQEVSTCTTTPGASCQIIFSQGSVSDTSAVEQTSAENSKAGVPAGTVSWSWTPAVYNLTPGEWQITATATLNGQSESTQDPTQLLISQ
ncbi:MAG TPA: hypothetical protein VMQ52_01570 [Candidatus Saccharimonadales bacterium]|jgi:hypothetical protein|nr:hypothetical protein [Candidatus Saccharimonadales bacterium]